MGAIAKTTQIQSDKADFTELFKETYFASYDDAWDTDMHYGCKCDAGYRGPSCALVECPSSADPLDDKCTTGTAITDSYAARRLYISLRSQKIMCALLATSQYIGAWN